MSRAAVAEQTSVYSSDKGKGGSCHQRMTDFELIMHRFVASNQNDHFPSRRLRRDSLRMTCSLVSSWPRLQCVRGSVFVIPQKKPSADIETSRHRREGMCVFDQDVPPSFHKAAVSKRTSFVRDSLYKRCCAGGRVIMESVLRPTNTAPHVVASRLPGR